MAALLEPYSVGRARAVYFLRRWREPQKRRNKMLGRQKQQVTMTITKMHALTGKWDIVHRDRNLTANARQWEIRQES